MVDNNSLLTLIVTFLSSGTLFALIQFLITRHDNKKNKTDQKLDDILHDISDLRKDVKEVYTGLEEHKAKLARTHILRFADELRNGMNHSDEYFRQQIRDIDTYNNYCDLHPEFANGLTKLASRLIEEEAWNHYKIPSSYKKE